MSDTNQNAVDTDSIDYSDAEYASAKAVVRGMVESLQLLVYRMREQHNDYEPPREVDADRVPQI